MKFCYECGHKLEKDYKICPNCGTKLIDISDLHNVKLDKDENNTKNNEKNEKMDNDSVNNKETFESKDVESVTNMLNRNISSFVKEAQEQIESFDTNEFKDSLVKTVDSTSKSTIEFLNKDNKYLKNAKNHIDKAPKCIMDSNKRKHYKKAINDCNKLIYIDDSNLEAYYLKALALSNLNDNDKALNVLNVISDEIINKNKESNIDKTKYLFESICFLKIKILKNLNRNYEVENQFDKLLEYFPDSIDGLFEKANFLFEISNYDKSKEVIDKLLDMHPYHEEGLIIQGKLALNSKDYKFAEKVFKKVVDTYYKNDEAWALKGEAELNNNKLKKAYNSFKTAVSINPSNKLASLTLEINDFGGLNNLDYQSNSSKKNKTNNSSINQKEYFDYDKNIIPNPHLISGIKLDNEFHNAKISLNLHKQEKLLKQFSLDIAYLQKLMAYYANKEEIDNVMYCGEILIEIIPSSFFDNDFKNLLPELMEGAIQVNVFEKIMGFVCNFSVQKANYLMDQEEYYKALEYFHIYNKLSANNVYATLNPNFEIFSDEIYSIPQLLSDEGYCFSQVGQLNTALECYDASLKLNPNDALTWFRKGHTFYILEKFEKSLNCFDKSLMLDNSNDDAWACKGLILVKLNRLDEGFNCFDNALKINPDNGVALKAFETWDYLNKK